MQLSRRALLGAGGVMGAKLLTPSTAFGEEAFPSRPVTVVVPFLAGGPTDVVARIVTADLHSLWGGQPVVLDNRAGAAGQIGGQVVAKARPDGYTLLFATIHAAVAPGLYPRMPYDIEKDFSTVCLAAEYPTVLCVNKSLPVRSVKELIAYAKANPGKLSFGSSGNGGATHLAGELFKHMVGVDMLHVPYKGSNAAMTDLIGGQVDLMFADAPTAMPQILGGRVLALAVGGSTRSKLLPSLPTIAESGLPGYEANSWAGIMAPKDVLPQRIALLNRYLNQAIGSTQVVRKLADNGAEARPGTPAAFAEKLSAERKKWAAVIRQAGIKAD